MSKFYFHQNQSKLRIFVFLTKIGPNSKDIDYSVAQTVILTWWNSMQQQQEVGFKTALTFREVEVAQVMTATKWHKLLARPLNHRFAGNDCVRSSTSATNLLLLKPTKLVQYLAYNSYCAKQCNELIFSLARFARFASFARGTTANPFLQNIRYNRS